MDAAMLPGHFHDAYHRSLQSTSDGERVNLPSHQKLL